MKIRRQSLPSGQLELAVLQHGHWHPLSTLIAASPQAVSPSLACQDDLIAILGGGDELLNEVRALLDQTAGQEAESPPETDHPLPAPFSPRSIRDFMLYEKHVIAAGRGYARRFLPKAWPVLNAYEKIFRKPHPKLRPKPLWYKHPIYYMGSHINILGHGDIVPWPPYSSALDYELELGIVVTKPLYNATPEEALQAIGGFTILNDFSARDCQLAEMTSGFGPVKAKNFANSIGPCVVETQDLLARADNLDVNVRINGQVVAESNTAGMHYSLGEMVAYASLGERVVPGELMGTGTIPGCCALENEHWLQPDDTIELTIEGIGSLTNRISHLPQDE